MTSYFAGRLVGAILAGAIHSKMNRYLIFVVAMVVNAIAVAAIPWCILYELMMTAHALHGISGGVLDVAVTSEGVSIWGDSDRGRSYFQILCAAFAVSGIFAPMATAPFLLPTDTTGVSWNSTNTSLPVNMILSNNQSEHSDNATMAIQETSRLYIAYSMSAGLTVIVTFPFLILFLRSGARCSIITVKKHVKSKFIGNRHRSLKCFQFLNAMVFSAVFSTIDLTFGGYLTVFCVRYLNWKKIHGAILTSLILFSQLVGRIFGAFAVRALSSHALLMLSTVVCTLGFVGLAICAAVRFDTGIWISVCVIGVPLGVLWPGFVSWTNTNLIPVTGKVSSSMFISAFTGAMISPLFLGFMMETSMMWFCYINFGESCIILTNALIMVWYTKYSSEKDSKTGIALVNRT
ncbi:uncharacterized protein LOC117343109 [Pecten maximus]|uniref:uncharacterized protein LOC117343109 n=1 Tax=Pecten maximus TaxID=6579 RepID=UPI0014583F3C|nr:uncharacterized protein LOC117343109 [Pecten maximus]